MRVAASVAIICALVTASDAKRVAARRPPASCHVTVHKAKLDVDNEKNVSRQKVVIVCKRSMRANVSLDKDYGKSLWKALEKDFKVAKINYSTLAITRECLDNPLAKGCS